MKIISLGAGVQSSVLALLSDRGELMPRADACIFADTQAEPISIYKHLEWLKKEISIPIHVVSAGNLTEDILKGQNSTGQDFITIPLFSKEGNKVQMGRRQCTREYKITPIQKKCRELAGYKRFQRISEGTIEMMIGITTDEASRMKDSRVKYIKNIFPLIDMEWSRVHCFKWFSENYPDRKLEKSACIFCPYRTNKEWIELKNNSSKEWEKVLAIDERLRTIKKDKVNYIHPSGKPIEEAINLKSEQINFFEQECEGMCGV